MSVLPASMYVCTMHGFGAWRGQKRVLDSHGAGDMGVVSFYVGAGYQTKVHCNKYS